MSTERPHSVSVAGGVVVDDHGRALLIQRRDNGKWEPPGGVLEREETIPEASSAKSSKRPESRSPFRRP